LRRSARTHGHTDRLDWRSLRAMIEAPAYFETRAKGNTVSTAIERGLSIEERGRRRMRARQRRRP
jgi:hypothetical protein